MNIHAVIYANAIYCKSCLNSLSCSLRLRIRFNLLVQKSFCCQCVSDECNVDFLNIHVNFDRVVRTKFEMLNYDLIAQQPNFVKTIQVQVSRRKTLQIEFGYLGAVVNDISAHVLFTVIFFRSFLMFMEMY